MSEMASWDEGVLTDAQAVLEASRCLMCDDPPCVAACPAGVPVKHFIRAIRFETPRRAINLIRERNVLAGVCGLACPTESLCVGACNSTELSIPIAIGELQHYAAVRAIEAGWTDAAVPGSGRAVAIIGAGPSGLAAAAELARAGHRPTIFEKEPRPGGICTYGVPSHRLPQSLVAAEIEYVESLGVEIRTDSPLGEGRTLDDLFAAGFEAVYVSAGAAEAFSPGIPGEELDGVMTWRELLPAASAFELGEKPAPAMGERVVVVGGGSVAMDVASVANTLGADELDIVCLESPREMPADPNEMGDVWDAGGRFHTRSMPIEVTGKGGKVTGLKAVRIDWKEPGHFVPSNAVEIEGTEYWLPADRVIFAIGARPVAALEDWLPGVEFDRSGRIVVDAETQTTSREGVFAGGDVAAGGGTTIVKAVAEGKRAGAAMAAYLAEG